MVAVRGEVVSVLNVVVVVRRRIVLVTWCVLRCGQAGRGQRGVNWHVWRVVCNVGAVVGAVGVGQVVGKASGEK